MMNPETIATLARQLYDARKTRQPLRHFSQQHPQMTIDDGYGPSEAMRMIQDARAAGVTITFCFNAINQGMWGQDFRDAVAKAVEDGVLEVCSHGYSHTTGVGTTEAFGRSDLARNVPWDRLAGYTTAPFYRPPFGAYGSGLRAAAAAQGYRYIVLWDVDTNDWKGPPPPQRCQAGQLVRGWLVVGEGLVPLHHARQCAARAGLPLRCIAGEGAPEGIGRQGLVAGQQQHIAGRPVLQHGGVGHKRDLGEPLEHPRGHGTGQFQRLHVNEVHGVEPTGAQHPAHVGDELPGGQRVRRHEAHKGIHHHEVERGVIGGQHRRTAITDRHIEARHVIERQVIARYLHDAAVALHHRHPRALARGHQVPGQRARPATDLQRVEAVAIGEPGVDHPDQMAQVLKRDARGVVQVHVRRLHPIHQQQTATGAAAPTPAGAPAAPAPLAHLRGTTQKANRIRKLTARKTRESLQQSAQLTQTHEVDMTKIVALRARAKREFAEREGVNLTYLPFIARAVIEALKAHPNVNASFDEEAGEITYYDAEHLGFAVDTDQGLLSPVIHNAGDLSLAGLARAINDIAARARSGDLKPDELAGGTFTITNIGSQGALFDTPILVPPQAAMLGTGAIVKRPRVIIDQSGNESIGVRSVCYLPLTYDHRLIDGADAGRFLTTIRRRLEEGAFEAELGL
ncbi:MAG: 2-oxoglutarate dehydrogenase, E2 component, dihydrolipoamide succinyltransferase [Mycobacteriaceae bacterium]|nr:2-oxoglutarate dehydrogenase, E2 component, dihydrolipoamide succinyltransferase [Mycobacteriaceae bacterium]